MNKNVLITGGSRGIGAAAVLAFAKAGYNVAFTYNAHPDAADAVAEAIRRMAQGASLPSGPTRATLFRCKPPWSRHSGN